jgi:hypothetical protein
VERLGGENGTPTRSPWCSRPQAGLDVVEELSQKSELAYPNSVTLTLEAS